MTTDHVSAIALSDLIARPTALWLFCDTFDRIPEFTYR